MDIQLIGTILFFVVLFLLIFYYINLYSKNKKIFDNFLRENDFSTASQDAFKVEQMLTATCPQLSHVDQLVGIKEKHFAVSSLYKKIGSDRNPIYFVRVQVGSKASGAVYRYHMLEQKVFFLFPRGLDSPSSFALYITPDLGSPAALGRVTDGLNTAGEVLIKAQKMDKLIMSGRPASVLRSVQGPRPSKRFMAYAQEGQESLDFLSPRLRVRLARMHKKGVLALFHHQGHTVFESIYLTPYNIQKGKHLIDPTRQFKYFCSFFD